MASKIEYLCYTTAMSKNKKRYEFNQQQQVSLADEKPSDSDPVSIELVEDKPFDEERSAIPESVIVLVNIAKEFNGKDHLSACSYYAVNHRDCDCGVRRLFNAALEVEALWAT